MDKVPPIAIDAVPNHGGHAQVRISKEDLEFLFKELQTIESRQDNERQARIAKKYGIHHWMHDLSTWKP